jgi:hypothetical protein
MSSEGVAYWGSVPGAFNQATFTKTVQDEILPLMGRFPRPRSVLVMDNCRVSWDLKNLGWGYRRQHRLLGATQPDRGKTLVAQSDDGARTGL